MNLRTLLSRIAINLVQARKEKLTEHPIAELIRVQLVEVIKNKLLLPQNYEVIGSAGQGNWADVAWVSIRNPVLSNSTRSGVYPVYLFCKDGSGVYLSLGFGTTDLTNKHGKVKAIKKAQEWRESIRKLDKRLTKWDAEIKLGATTPLGCSYEWASAGAKFYSINKMPDEAELSTDLTELFEIYANISIKTNQYSEKKVLNTLRLSKPFLLLAGISGTGKTRFVREQAKASKQFTETYCLTSVRPDWHEPSDLLGYISRLNGTSKYITTDVLQFIAKAWRAIVDANLKVGIVDSEGHGKRLVVEGGRNDLSSILPYWLCLDEMNLAPVEQYFADYLSVLETREWNWKEDGTFIYSCDMLLKSVTIDAVDDKNMLRKELGFGSEKYDKLWIDICDYGIGIPFNLLVAGTVNMDETTHGFSRKVIDRALCFDFGVFFPNNYEDFFKPTTFNKYLSYPIWSHASKTDLANTYDTDGIQSIAFLTKVNAVLKNTPFELAFRALNELLLAVTSVLPQDELTIMAVWDDFMMCKVLPRIEGDIDKLTTSNGKGLLDELDKVLNTVLEPIWDTENNNLRPDLFRENIVESNTDKISKVCIRCRSKNKLQWMRDRLASTGFTSFWP